MLSAKSISGWWEGIVIMSQISQHGPIWPFFGHGKGSGCQKEQRQENIQCFFYIKNVFKHFWK